MEPLDFKSFFEASPIATLVLRPDLTICAANNAFLQVTTTSRAIVGLPLAEVFPETSSAPPANGAMRASVRLVLAEKKPHRMGVQRYFLRRRQEDGGAAEERFWSAWNEPVIGPTGDVQYILHHAEDVTEVVTLRREKLVRDQDLARVTERSERYVQLLDSAPDAIVIVGEDGLIQLVNVRTETLFGYARSELVRQRLDMLVPERFRRAHADHLSRFFANPGARAMGTGIELFGRRKDGSEVPIEVSLSPHRRAGTVTVSAAIRDITERKRLEAAARLTADRLASAVDSMQDAFALFDAEDRLILCNSVYRRLLNRTMPGALVGKTFPDLLDAWMKDMDFPDADARQRFRDERLARRQQDDTVSFEVRLLDGRRLRVVDRKTGEGGMVKTIWDLTEDSQLAEELREARAEAEAASAAKSEFLSSMSHELRTPLNAILGFAQLLQLDHREPLSEKHKERVGYILSGGEHLLHLIDDVLDLARIEARRVSVSIEIVRLRDVLDEVKKTLEPMAARQGIRLSLELDAGEAPEILADPTRFSQILINFGSNAIKYNRPGGSVRFTVSRPSESTVRVAVADNGLGIPADQQQKLFQPFQRAGQENGPIEGTGIGLVITKQLVLLMRGSLGFQSALGSGSEFWVDMPVPTASRESASPRRQAVAPVVRVSGAAGPHLVLYVEDNPANVNFMRDLMSSLVDIDLLCVPNAELGVEMARARRPSAVIMDINLPGMSGVDALLLLQSLPETADTPVIALTAAASDRDKQAGAQAGFFRYLTKPICVVELMGALEDAFRCAAEPAMSAL